MPDAGWYPDPGGTPDLRWWDGHTWTDHTHSPPAAASGQTAGQGWGQTSGESGGGDVPWWGSAGDGSPPSWWQSPGPGAGNPGAARAAPPTADPYAATRTLRPIGRAEGATKALVISLVSLLCCGIILGPYAIYLGSQVRYRVRVSNGRLSGDGMALAAMIIGGISVALFFLGAWAYASGGSATTSP